MDNPLKDQAEDGVVPRTSLRHLWPLALLPLAALAWGIWSTRISPHQNHWRQKLEAFRADASADSPSDESPRMADVLIVRGILLRSFGQQPPMKLSPPQERLLFSCLTGPDDERVQSEALDVLTMAHRAGVLSPTQVHRATEGCLAVLSRTPPPMVRLEGARFLSHSKTPGSISALRLLLNDPVPKIQDAARQGLADVR